MVEETTETSMEVETPSETTAEAVIASETSTEAVITSDSSVEAVTTSDSIEEAVTPSTTSPSSLGELKPKMKLTGTVKRLELYGAFVDIGIDVNALIHISQLGKSHVNRVSDVLNIDDEINVWVDKVDSQRQQVMVTMIEPLAVEWRDLKAGQTYKGTISRLEDFGAFIDIGAEREGLVHISELSHGFVKHPKELLTVGNEIEVQVLGFNRRKRRIDLSIKALQEKPETVTAAPREAGPVREKRRSKRRDSEERRNFVAYEGLNEEEMPTAMEIAMRKAMGDLLPNAGKASARTKESREKLRGEQENILSRTLQIQQES